MDPSLPRLPGVRLTPSTIAYQPPEDVELDERGSMTTARKKRIHKARGGKCWMCGQDVPALGPDVIYDHKLPLELGGSDADANIWPLHREPCNRLKTAADLRRIAKVRRQSFMRLDKEKPPPTQKLRGRGFRKRWGE